MLDNHDVALRLLAAALLGGIVGFEREWKNQLAGFRTHIILCVGSALVMMVSIYMAASAPADRPVDPTRIAAQVVSGIGFLGAGAILRMGISVKGVTTAASLWTIAGIGLAVGSGFYYGAGMATVIMLLALTILSRLEHTLLLSKRERNLIFSASSAPDLLGKVEQALLEYNVSLVSIKLHKDNVQNRLEVQGILQVPKGTNLSHLTAHLSHIEEISELEIH